MFQLKSHLHCCWSVTVCFVDYLDQPSSLKYQLNTFHNLKMGVLTVQRVIWVCRYMRRKVCIQFAMTHTSNIKPSKKEEQNNPGRVMKRCFRTDGGPWHRQLHDTDRSMTQLWGLTSWLKQLFQLIRRCDVWWCLVWTSLCFFCLWAQLLDRMQNYMWKHFPLHIKQIWSWTGQWSENTLISM